MKLARPYKLRMVIPNIKHTQWWWNGVENYEFESLDKMLEFMKKRIPMTDRSVAFIRDNDSKKERGRLACTSWYEVIKGNSLMTEYTSF